MNSFIFPFVKEVFLDENYVSVSKYDVDRVGRGSPCKVREFIRDFLADGKEVVSQEVQLRNAKQTEPTQQENQTQYDATSTTNRGYIGRIRKTRRSK